MKRSVLQIVTIIVVLVPVTAWAQKAPAPGELARAVADGNRRLVDQLLSRGADPDQSDADGRSPLHHAAGIGDYSLVQRLLTAGANPDPIDGEGMTPLMSAVGRSRPDIGVLLLSRGADPDVVTSAGSALSLAVERGDFAVARRLVAFGADGLLLADPQHGAPNPLDLPVLTVPLDARMWRDGAALTDYADSPDWDAALGRDGDRWAVHRAARDGGWSALRTLLDSGVPPDATDDRGVSPLMTASFHGRESVVSLLLQRGADPDARDNTGRDALCYAAYAGERGVVGRLLTAVPQPPDSGVTRDGGLYESPVYYALIAHRTGVLDDLLNAGIAVSPTDADGVTLLMAAAWLSDTFAVRRLLPLTDGTWESTVRPAARDQAGRTALDWALASFRRDRETARQNADPDRTAADLAIIRLLAGRDRPPGLVQTRPSTDTRLEVITAWSPESGAADRAEDWRQLRPSPVPAVPGDGDLTVYRILRDEEPGTPSGTG